MPDDVILMPKHKENNKTMNPVQTDNNQNDIPVQVDNNQNNILEQAEHNQTAMVKIEIKNEVDSNVKAEKNAENNDQQIQENEIQDNVQAIQENKQEEQISLDQLKQELEKWDAEYAFLNDKSQTSMVTPKFMNRNNRNFLERYKKRNQVTLMMSSAIRSVKNNLKNNFRKKNIREQQEEVKKIQELLKEAEATDDEIWAEDVKLKTWNAYLSHDNEAQEIMNNIVADAKWTDSGWYTDVVRAIGAYRENASEQTLKNLVEKVDAYIKKRGRNGNKKDEEFKPRGLARIQNMRALLDKIQFQRAFTSYQEEEKEKNEQAMKKESLIQHENKVAQEVYETSGVKKLKDFYNIEKELAGLREACFTVISDDMLTLEYYNGHKEEMKHFAELVKNTKRFIKKWDKDHANKKIKIDFSDEMIREKVYGIYGNLVRRFLKNYKTLEAFVEACEKKDEKKIEKSRNQMISTQMDKKAKTFYHKVLKNKFDKELGAIRVLFICGIDSRLTYANINGDKGRLGGMLPVWKLGDNGEFVSERDRELFEMNIDYVNALFKGDVEACIGVINDYFSHLPKLKVDEKLATREYLEEHFTELEDFTMLSGNCQNIIEFRSDAKEAFEKRYHMSSTEYAKKYSDDSREMQELNNNIGIAMSAVAEMNGFSHAQGTIRDMDEGEGMEEQKKELDVQLNLVKQSLEKIKEAISKVEEK